MLVIFCLFSLVAYATLSGGEEVLAPNSTLVSNIQMMDTVKNNGPVSIDNEITFSGKCIGEETRLIVCRNAATSCDTDTLPSHLICLSQKTNEEEKSCMYITTLDDVGEHLQDTATCCDEQGKCAETTTTVEGWEVTTAPLTIKDDGDNPVQATFNQQEMLLIVSFADQPITKLQFTAVEGNEIGVSKITRGIIPPEGVEFARIYGLDMEEIAFTEATLYAISQGSSLYICKFWDFTLSTCVGSWELVKPIPFGQEYTFNLMKGSFGFAEATTEAQPTEEPVLEPPLEEPVPAPLPKPELPVIEEPTPVLEIKGPIINDGPVEQGKEITFSGGCISEQQARLMLCRDNIACNAETSPEHIVCSSPYSLDEKKSCTHVTIAEDIGENTDAIATCCTEDSNCAKQTIVVEPWTVTAQPEIIQDILESEEDIQEQAEVNKPVKWRKRIKLGQEKSKIVATLPITSTDIKVRKRDAAQVEELLSTEWTIADRGEKKELTINKLVKDVEVEYTTEAPQMEEYQMETYKKHVILSSTTHYTNISTYTLIPETEAKNIRLYRLENNTKQLVEDVQLQDTNGDNKIDKLAWIVPHLSNQTYEVIFLIKADHLNENKEFVSDIYDQVRDLDNVWSETIPAMHYVRISFNAPLVSSNDITIFPRVVGGNPRIEIYQANQSTLIATFASVTSNAYNRVYLDGLLESENSFDLRILDGNVEFDHIIDPTLTISNITQLCGEVTQYDTIVVTNTGELEICYNGGATDTG